MLSLYTTVTVLVTAAVSPTIILFNLVVIYPFLLRSSSRLHNPTNHLILCLASVDVFSAVALPVLVSMRTLAFVDNVTSCYFSLIAMSLLETSGVIIVAAIALDKIISLARPLHYNEIVTQVTFYSFLATVASVSVVTAVLPLANHERSWSDVANNGSATVDFSRCFDRRSGSATYKTILFLGIQLPSSVVVCLGYLYVFCVAKRHAKGIRLLKRVVRNKEQGDKAHQLAASANRPASLNDLEERQQQQCQRQHRSTIVGSDLHIAAGKDAGLCVRYSYGTTLLLTILTFLICRMAAPLYYLAKDEVGSGGGTGDLLQFLTFANGLMDPWLYAYHNLDLKPFMRRYLTWTHQRRRQHHPEAGGSDMSAYQGHTSMPERPFLLLQTTAASPNYCHSTSHHLSAAGTGGKNHRQRFFFSEEIHLSPSLKRMEQEVPTGAVDGPDRGGARLDERRIFRREAKKVSTVVVLGAAKVPIIIVCSGSENDFETR